MKKRRIICIGNRYRDDDSVGWLVWEKLRQEVLPEGVELVDGGLGGLNLMGLVEAGDTAVFVDQTCGFGLPGEVRVLKGVEFCGGTPGHYGHGDGLAYLLNMMAANRDGGLSGISVVGVEGPADQGTIERAARYALAEVCRCERVEQVSGGDNARA